MKKLITLFGHFFYLGWISFGGPAAHLGYFQRYFVQKHRWIESQKYAQLVALSQFLPGPGSSQVGFAIGYEKAGLPGAITAFVGFTLPSFFLMFIFALAGIHFADSLTVQGAITGLKLLAVVVVADAILTMAKSFCQHNTTRLIAIVSMLLLAFFSAVTSQLIILMVAALVGLVLYKGIEEPSTSSAKVGLNKFALTVIILLTLAPLIAIDNSLIKLFHDFFSAGSLVFGGGHVVLPLLQESIAGQLSNDEFLMGYGAAQAIPGPMFTLATFLGGLLTPENPLTGAAVATIGIFLPGFLLVLIFYKAWHSLMANPKVAGAVWGVNAAVVGLLAAAFYQPIAINAIHQWQDLIYVAVGFYLLRWQKVPIIALVISYLGLGIGLTL